RIARLLEDILQRWGDSTGDGTGTEVGVCPPFVYLSQVAEQLAGSPIRLGAQDLSPCESGAHTGDVCAEMLVDVGCHYVIVGHSERRKDHAESNALVAEKFAAARAAGLTPIVCVGETLEQREAGHTLAVIREQLKPVLDRIGAEQPGSTVIAYEPVWAIGTGRTASPEQAQEVHAFLREQLGAGASATRILYGGSVKAENAEALFRQPDIDGGLIGG